MAKSLDLAGDPTMRAMVAIITHNIMRLFQGKAAEDSLSIAGRGLRDGNLNQTETQAVCAALLAHHGQATQR